MRFEVNQRLFVSCDTHSAAAEHITKCSVGCLLKLDMLGGRHPTQRDTRPFTAADVADYGLISQK